jgi:hypothetical protein
MERTTRQKIEKTHRLVHEITRLIKHFTSLELVSTVISVTTQVSRRDVSGSSSTRQEWDLHCLALSGFCLTFACPLDLIEGIRDTGISEMLQNKIPLDILRNEASDPEKKS